MNRADGCSLLFYLYEIKTLLIKINESLNVNYNLNMNSKKNNLLQVYYRLITGKKSHD